MFSGASVGAQGDWSLLELRSVTKADHLAVPVDLAGSGNDRPNCLPIMEDWNYTVRLYQPHPEVLDRTWTFPTIETSGR